MHGSSLMLCYCSTWREATLLTFLVYYLSRTRTNRKNRTTVRHSINRHRSIIDHCHCRRKIESKPPLASAASIAPPYEDGKYIITIIICLSSDDSYTSRPPSEALCPTQSRAYITSLPICTSLGGFRILLTPAVISSIKLTSP